MGASSPQIVLALWAAVVLAGTIRASCRRSLLQCPGYRDSLGLTDCGCVVFAGPPYSGSSLASGCPRDGQHYVVCLVGNAAGGCKLGSQGTFPPADCGFNCWFQSGVSSNAPPVALPTCVNAVVGNQPGLLKTTQCPRDGQVYQVCLLGNGLGGCRPISQGPWPQADCGFACTFNTSATSG